MDPAAREAQRAANREKNQRRRQNKKTYNTLYARQGRDLRVKMGGAFGKAPAAVFNKCAEGTAAVRRAETDLTEEPDE